MASVQANGITIEYDEQGSGQPLLLVMGLGGQLTDWPQGFVDLVSDRGFRVIRFDNRDSGLSTEFAGPAPTTWQLAQAALFRRPLASEYRLSDMADDAAALLATIDVDSAHVVGMSMGGMIAQMIAIQHPHRVRSLTSIMSTTGSRKVGQPTKRLIAKFVCRKPGTRATAIDDAVETFRDVCGPTFDETEFRELAKASTERSFRPNGTARQMAAILVSGGRTDELARLDVPTLVVHGLLDPLVRPTGGIATADAVPGSRLLMFNDMAHDLPRTRWVEMADAISQNAARAAVVATA